MQKLKLTPNQKAKLSQAIAEEQKTSNEFRIAQAAAGKASNHRQDILDMIWEAHNVDRSSIDPAARIEFKDRLPDNSRKECVEADPAGSKNTYEKV